MGTPSLIGWTKYWYSPFSIIGASRSDCRNWSMSPVLGRINKAWRLSGPVNPDRTGRGAGALLEGATPLLEVGLPLLQERRHPLALVVGAEQSGPRPALQGEPAGLRPVAGGVERLLRRAHRERGLRGQLPRQLVDPVVERVVGDDLADETDVGRLARVDPLAEEDESLRGLVADQPREPLGPAPTGDDPRSISVCPITALSAATRRSQASASSEPPPNA